MRLSEILESEELTIKEKADTVIENANEDSALQTILGQIDNPSPYMRCAVANALATRGSRACFEPLKQLIDDPDDSVRTCATLFLGISKDSRAIFCYANLWQTRPDLQQRIVLGLKELKDPRAPEFIQKIYPEIKNSLLQDLALEAREASEKNKDFVYTFHGIEQRRKQASRTTGQVQLRSPEDLDRIANILEQRKKEMPDRPQTYIIAQGERFMTVGGNIDEHVDVAKGRNVIAAGEITFQKRGDLWVIDYVNNRSNGYYPGTDFTRVAKALERANIAHPDKFSETFPKDGYFTDDFLRHQPFYVEG